MKRILSLLMIITMVFVFAACQVTPEKPIVVKKDTERMIEKAQDEGKGLSLPDLMLPDGNYTFSATGAEGRLTIHVDAPVSTPESGDIPMARVSAAGFTQEQITGFFNYLFPDEKPTYYVSNEGLGIMTKDEIQNQIIFYKKLIAEGTIAEKSIFVSEEEVNEEIAKLEEQLKTAPDTVPAPEIKVSDGTLPKAKWGIGFENKLIYEEDIYRLDAQLENTSITAVTPESAHGKVEAYFIYWQAGGPAYSETNAVAYDKNILPESAARKLTISCEDAKKLCDNFFVAGGIDNVALRDVFIIDDERFGNFNGIVAPAENYAYCFNYSRKVNDTPVYAVTTIGNEGDSNALPWSYERIFFYVDNEGIRTAMWYSPTDTGEIVSDNPGIISFEEAKVIFEKMVVHTYEPQARATSEDGLLDTKIDVSINNIELSLVRIREQNTNGRNGIYTPAWIFYGNVRQEQQWAGQDAFVNYDGGYPTPLPKRAVLVINAVDGSIIDLNKGY